MKKKKSLYKYIKKEMKELNTMLSEIDRLDNDLFKHIALRRTREEYFNIHIKPLMLIYQASKNAKMLLEKQRQNEVSLVD